jgi:hypothetical protein
MACQSLAFTLPNLLDVVFVLTAAGFDMGQGQDANYFRSGEAGYHKQWDSRILNYGHWEVRSCYMTMLLTVTS